MRAAILGVGLPVLLLFAGCGQNPFETPAQACARIFAHQIDCSGALAEGNGGQLPGNAPLLIEVQCSVAIASAPASCDWSFVADCLTSNPCGEGQFANTDLLSAACQAANDNCSAVSLPQP